jgi:hypothetical protein
MDKNWKFNHPPPAAITHEKRERKGEDCMIADAAKLNSLSIRFDKFKTILESPNIDLGIYI